MRIKNIHIENFKGIESKDIIFNDRFTVFIGDNGTGKSSILDAVSIAIGTILMKSGASFGYSGAKTRPLLKDEIRKVIVSPDNIENTDVVLSGEFIYQNDVLDWSRIQQVNAKSLSYKDSFKLTNLGLDFSKNIQKQNNLPLFVHHTTARLWGDIYDKSRTQKTSSRLDGYYACLDSRSIQNIFFYWFKTFEDSVLKFDKDKALYNAFTNAITTVVPEWSKIHFSWELEDLTGLTSEGKWMPLRNLSDGYKSIIRLAADIAYRAIKLNPHLGERAVIETEGIVMIDEIDMHLHPKWQRHIVDDLKRTFPKIQFIVTTHSPFIIQSLKADEVISLDSEIINEDPFTKSIEEIAEQDMNVAEVKRSKKFLHYIDIAAKYFALIEEGKNSNEKEKLKNELDLLELEFNDDPVYLALMKAERKSEFNK
jgi:predicted ATP-binding protein involved in virulence